MQIENILNNMEGTGEYTKEIKSGILSPLAWPPNKYANINVRLIVLLFIIRKILTFTLIERIWNCIKEVIQRSQEAYQEEVSTFEQVFSLKAMVEKAIPTENNNMWIMLLGMSKVFDSATQK